MRRRRRLIAAIAGTAIAIAVLLAAGMWLRHLRLPKHNGRAVDHWIRELALQGSSNESEKALNAMGTNALPHLAKAVQQKQGWLDRTYRRLWRRSPRLMQPIFPEPVPMDRLRLRSIRVIEEIGHGLRWRNPLESSEPPPQLVRAVDALADALSSPDPRLRITAAQALAYIGPHADSAVPALTAMLKSGTPGEQKKAARALGSIGPPAAGTVPVLRQTLREADADVRLQALQALNSYGPKSKAALPEVTEHLDSKDDVVRRAATQAVAAIGHCPPEARPTLEKSLNDPDQGIQAAAAVALWHNDPSHDRAKEVVFASLQDPEETNLRSATANLVKWMGPKAEEAVPILSDLVDDDAGMVRIFALRALERIAPDMAEQQKQTTPLQ